MSDEKGRGAASGCSFPPAPPLSEGDISVLLHTVRSALLGQVSVTLAQGLLHFMEDTLPATGGKLACKEHQHSGRGQVAPSGNAQGQLEALALYVNAVALLSLCVAPEATSADEVFQDVKTLPAPERGEGHKALHENFVRVKSWSLK